MLQAYGMRCLASCRKLILWLPCKRDVVVQDDMWPLPTDKGKRILLENDKNKSQGSSKRHLRDGLVIQENYDAVDWANISSSEDDDIEHVLWTWTQAHIEHSRYSKPSSIP